MKVLPDRGDLRSILENTNSWTYQRLSYNSWVSRKHKYLFIGVPKAACTKVKMLLQELEGLPIPENLAELHHRTLLNHPFVSSLSCFDTDTTLRMLTSDEWFRFCFVRNPYRRIFSAYKSKIMREDPQYIDTRQKLRTLNSYPVRKGALAIVTFRDFVRFVKNTPDEDRDGHWRSQKATLLHNYIDYHFVGRTEHFAQQFSTVLQRLGSTVGVHSRLTERVNTTPGIPLAAVFDSELADEVFCIYEDDFETFGYGRGSWIFDK